MKVYLDTSVISALFDETNPERKSLTETFFKEIENFEVYISEIVDAEIERTLDIELRNKMKEVSSKYSILPLTDDVEWLANEYIRYEAIPKGYPEDVYHIAIVVINEIDFLFELELQAHCKAKDKRCGEDGKYYPQA